MVRMIEAVKVIVKGILAGVMALVILSMFVYGYSYTGVHVTNMTHATDYTWESKQWRSTMTEGFSWLHTDENGYNNQNVPENIDVLVMGSSHMEGFNVGENENAVALLNQNVPELSFYNIGISGHDIYRCIDNIASALDYYQPSKYVIIETDTVDLNKESMGRVIDGTAQAIPSYDTGLMYYTQKLPAVKWLFKQFQDWVNVTGTEKLLQAEPSMAEENAVSVNELLVGEFLEKVSQAAEQHACKAIIVYHPTLDIEFFESGGVPPTSSELDVFKNQCAEKRILFVDLTDDFISLYKDGYILAHGFANSTVGQGHLNQFGHEAMAKRLATVIRADMQEEGVQNDLE